MKIALCSTYVPFVKGGYRNIVEWLQLNLERSGHEVETIYLPEVDWPATQFDQMMAFRWIDLSAADRVICFRPQAHLIDHPHKILWFIHHIRVYYDLWDSPYRGFLDDEAHRGFRDAIHAVDTAAMVEARTVFTNSSVVSKRLSDFNGIEGQVLFPPVLDPERYRNDGDGDEIVVVCRIEHHNRQHLLVEAMAHTTTGVRLRLTGASFGEGYVEDLKARVKELGLEERVRIEDRWVSEEEKIDRIAGALCVAYVPVDEDSYGYPSVEGSHASKPILTTTDAGGVLELVRHGDNGLVCEPTAEALAMAMDQLYGDRERTAAMGKRACERLEELGVSWSSVIERLLA